jgi:hypothetical protein
MFFFASVFRVLAGLGELLQHFFGDQRSGLSEIRFAVRANVDDGATILKQMAVR